MCLLSDSAQVYLPQSSGPGGQGSAAELGPDHADAGRPQSRRLSERPGAQFKITFICKGVISSYGFLRKCLARFFFEKNENDSLFLVIANWKSLVWVEVQITSESMYLVYSRGKSSITPLSTRDVSEKS